MKTYNKLDILEKSGWLCVNPKAHNNDKMLCKAGYLRKESSKPSNYKFVVSQYFNIQDAWKKQFERNSSFAEGYSEGMYDALYK